MKVTKVNRFSKIILEKYNQHERHDGLHLSLLVGCMRRNFYYYVNNREVSDKTKFVFMRGFALEDKTRSILEQEEDYDVLEQQEEIAQFGDVKLYYTPDIILYDRKNGEYVVIEVKSTDYGVEESLLKAYFVEQLVFYMSLKGIRRGYLLIFVGKDKEILEFEIILTDYDMRLARKEIELRLMMFLGALESGNWKTLRKAETYLCKFCPLKNECLNYNFGEWLSE